MKIFAIGDLHLPGMQEKPMDIFGMRWKDHPRRIAAAWNDLVGEEDLVLVPGDLSWAMKLEEAVDDLEYLGRLPGSKVIIRGNHDYWWQAIGKVRKALPERVYAIQNDFVHVMGKWAVCGTRGWLIPQHPEFGEDDERLLDRELNRLELSLSAAQRAGFNPDVVMLHYPPLPQNGEETGFSQLLEKYEVRLCVYGHLHGEAARHAVQGEYRGVRYVLAACDAIQFTPTLVAETDVTGSLSLVE